MTPSDVFDCKKCGDCCRGYGGTFVSVRDIEAIAAYTNTDPEKFVKEKCQMSGGKPVLAQSADGYCIFWDEVCTIHPVKPRMCKAWPFINNILVDVNNWYIMAGSCPGIRIDAPDSVVIECVKKMLSPEYSKP
ncbi:MAG: YkgJ family cysteine cluster protein [Deltaproteobacteria bacterium]|nr:YkgJ family cysteine cluster protein [Deltaproteobacteria bacterium]